MLQPYILPALFYAKGFVSPCGAGDVIFRYVGQNGEAPQTEHKTSHVLDQAVSLIPNGKASNRRGSNPLMEKGL